MPPRFSLLQCRNPDDPVRAEELSCFAARLGVPEHHIRPIDILRDPMNDVFDHVDCVLVGGSGDYSVLDPLPQIARFIGVLVDACERDFPMFASCFGFQALAKGLGGYIVHDEDNAEVGSYELTKLPLAAEDPLFRDIPETFVAQLGHKDRAETLPGSLLPLARSERVPFQAFRVAEAPIYGTQFHPEMTDQDNRRRLERYMDKYGHGLFGPEEALRRLESHRPSPHSNALLPRFVKLFVREEGE